MISTLAFTDNCHEFKIPSTQNKIGKKIQSLLISLTKEQNKYNQILIRKSRIKNWNKTLTNIHNVNTEIVQSYLNRQSIPNHHGRDVFHLHPTNFPILGQLDETHNNFIFQDNQILEQRIYSYEPENFGHSISHICIVDENGYNVRRPIWHKCSGNDSFIHLFKLIHKIDISDFIQVIPTVHKPISFLPNISLYFSHSAGSRYFTPLISSLQSKYMQQILVKNYNGCRIFKYKCNITLRYKYTLKYFKTPRTEILELYDEDFLLEKTTIYLDPDTLELHRLWETYNYDSLGIHETKGGFLEMIKDGITTFIKFTSERKNIPENNISYSIDIDDDNNAQLKIDIKSNLLVKDHSIHGYKAVKSTSGQLLLLKLEIPNGAKVASNNYAVGKFRTNHITPIKLYKINISNQTKVDGIEILDFYLDSTDEIECVSCIYTKSNGYKYKIGEEIILTYDQFNPSLKLVCTKGIHYCLTFREALEFHLQGPQSVGKIEFHIDPDNEDHDDSEDSDDNDHKESDKSKK
jgi:hypothetical protein